MLGIPQPISRSRIVEIARSWLGTPYHHQASSMGAGCDCIGLVRGVYRSLYETEPDPIPGYSPDWLDTAATDSLMASARRYLIEIPIVAAASGDVLVFRYRARGAAKHAGIQSTNDSGGSSFIHAMEGLPVSEAILTHWWRRRIVGAFVFPGVLV